MMVICTILFVFCAGVITGMFVASLRMMHAPDEKVRRAVLDSLNKEKKYV